MKIKPIDDRVLVVPFEIETTLESGIIIPDTAKEKPIIGLVEEVGSDEDLREIIKPGDKVLYGKYAGEDISINNKEYKIISRVDILAVIED